MRVNQATLARMLEVSRQAIGDLVTRGVLTVDDAGLIDVEAAREAIANSVRPSSKTAQALGTTPSAPAGPITDAADIKKPTDENTAVTSYHVAKTLNEAALAGINQHKLRELRGELIAVKAVETALAGALSGMREHMLQIAPRLAPLLAAETDVFRVSQMLEEEINHALQHMAKVQMQPAKGAQA
jgi:hypothetical protein